MRSWKTVSRKPVLDYGRYLQVEEHRVELPDGRVIPDWPWLEMPDYVSVVAITRESRFLCFRQTKYAVEGTSLAVPGGYLEAGEDPAAAARRELLEETGYEATEWISFGAYSVDGNRGAGRAHFYLALGCEPAAAPVADDLEAQELREISRAEIEEALGQGEFKSLSWLTAVLLALRFLKDRETLD
jgi:ADP-ribose pyrophosphatase